MTDRPLADIPPTPRGHLGLLFYEAAFAVAELLRARAGGDGTPVTDAFPFLGGYLDEVACRAPGLDPPAQRAWLAAAIHEWEGIVAGWLPLRALERAGLDRLGIQALVLLSLIEEDSGFGDVFASLDPAGGRRPGLSLLRRILALGAGQPVPDAWALAGPLVERGLADVQNPEAPRSEWVLRIPPPIGSALRGDAGPTPAPGLRHTPCDSLERLDDLIAPDDLLARLKEAALLLAGGGLDVVLLRGMPGTDRFTIAGGLARWVGRGVLQATLPPPPATGPLATLLGAIPLLEPELGPADTLTLPLLPGYSGPLMLLLGHDGGVAHVGPAVCLEIPPDAAPERLRHWHRALGSSAGSDLPDLAEGLALSGGYIRQCAPLAVAHAALARRSTVQAEDVRAAARAVSRQQLDALAQRLPAEGGWDQLVLAPGAEADLADLERRCRYREQLATALAGGLPGGLTRGVRALLEGPSGTGKTLAARTLAAVLGRDLYRLDLAAVVNKYIGETEKNLSRVLSRAEDLDVILLLDEGDALLARRTDVRTSNDRYANLETNYLLQRLETYDGIVLISTNLGSQLDPAFRRRMDVVVRFPPPDAEARWRLWQLHLPAGHQVAGEELEAIAARHPLSGAQIRNACLHAALLALHRGGSVCAADLVAGIQVECRKAGAAFAEEAPVRPAAMEGIVTAFLGAVS